MRRLVIIACLMASNSFYAKSQTKSINAYYDALTLRKCVDYVQAMQSNQFKISDTVIVLGMIKSYYPTLSSLSPKNLAMEISVSGKDTYNPFLAGLLPSSYGSSSVKSSISAFAKDAGSLAGTIPGLPVTNFADGYAQFLIERANQELNILFFQRFKEVLSESQEFQTVFPKTYAIFKVSEPYQYAANIQILKAAFKEDFANLIYNLEDLASLDKYQHLASKDPRFKFIFISLAGVAIAKHIKDGEHPADVIKGLPENSKYLNTVNNNILPSLQVARLLSESLRDSSKNEAGYVDWSLVRDNLIQDQITFQIYLGLLYQQIKLENGGKGITFYKIDSAGVKADSVELSSLLKNNSHLIKNLNLQIRSLAQSVDDVEGQVKKIKALDDDNKEVSYVEYYNLIDYSLDVLDLGATILKTVGVEKKLGKFDEMLKYKYAARLSNEVFKNVNEKNYSLAVLNVTSLLDSLLSSFDPKEQFTGDKSKDGQILVSLINEDFTLREGVDAKKSIRKELKNRRMSGNIKKGVRNYIDTAQIQLVSTKFLKYAAFMAAIAESESPESVKDAIKAAALPAGSASIKKNVNFNVSINSYLGASYAPDWIGKGSNKVVKGGATEKFNSLALWAPVGLAFSFGNIGKKNPSSISLYGTLLDVGSFASFRLKNGNDEVLPEIELKNIVAPGVHLIYGFPKVPFSVSAGYQWGPALREFQYEDSGEIRTVTGSVKGWRVGFSFDIPVFNLFSSAN